MWPARRHLIGVAAFAQRSSPAPCAGAGSIERIQMNNSMDEILNNLKLVGYSRAVMNVLACSDPDAIRGKQLSIGLEKLMIATDQDVETARSVLRDLLKVRSLEVGEVMHHFVALVQFYWDEDASRISFQLNPLLSRLHVQSGPNSR